jgi:hypothetical protein
MTTAITASRRIIMLFPWPQQTDYYAVSLAGLFNNAGNRVLSEG